MKKAAKKTAEEYKDEITTLHIKMEDLGKKEKVAGREVYTHITWADRMEMAVRGAKYEGATTYIGHTQKELPRLLKEKIGTRHKNWLEFLQVIQNIDMEHIQEGIDTWKKEQETQEVLTKHI